MLRVLITDDDPAAAARYRRHVSRVPGFVIQGVAHGSGEALRILENISVDLLILDQFLSGMTGMELLTHVRRAGIEVDAIMISSVSEGRNVQMALRYGAVDYLVKPFDFARFRRALETYRDRTALLQSAAPLRQADIDARILAQTGKHFRAAEELPKGLERETLERIRRAAACRAAPFSTQDMADIMGISRVTARKYLEYLKRSGIIRSSLSYRAAGRPLSLYQHISPCDDSPRSERFDIENI